MTIQRSGFLVLAAALLAIQSALAWEWPTPKATAVPGTDGYVVIPNVAVPPEASTTYRAIYNATQAAARPSEVIPALNMAGSELNALAAIGAPLDRAKFVVVFHGDSMDGILDNAHYRAKYGMDNPNLAVLSALRKAGTEIYVCGQNMAFLDWDPASISHDVTIASDALIVLMTYQNRGYALLDF